MTNDRAQEWKAAADSEYQSLLENDTWELVELPHRWKAYICDDKVECFKRCLVAKDTAKNMALIMMRYSHQ